MLPDYSPYHFSFQSAEEILIKILQDVRNSCMKGGFKERQRLTQNIMLRGWITAARPESCF